MGDDLDLQKHKLLRTFAKKRKQTDNVISRIYILSRISMTRNCANYEKKTGHALACAKLAKISPPVSHICTILTYPSKASQIGDKCPLSVHET